MNALTLPLRLRATRDPSAALSEIASRIERSGISGSPFEVVLSTGESRSYGHGAAAFRVVSRDPRGDRALASFDDLSIAEAYMTSHVEIEGDVFALLGYRALLSDRRPIHYLWETYLQPIVRGQIAIDKKVIPHHYDLPVEFFLLWLGERVRCYSHGFFESDDESLEVATTRKLDFAMSACGIQPGDRVLDIGGGWGSFLEHAGKRGVEVTSLTISPESARYMRELIARHGWHGHVVEEHLLEYRPAHRFDAIVNFGVSEHLPDYHATLAQYDRLLEPGRRIYLDAYSGQRFENSSFLMKWAYEGSTSPLNLPRYLAAVERTDFEVLALRCDARNYQLTCRKWAERLDAHHGVIAERWGEQLYRRFRLYLWGCARAFADGGLSAHHLVLERRPGLRAARKVFRF